MSDKTVIAKFGLIPIILFFIFSVSFSSFYGIVNVYGFVKEGSSFVQGAEVNVTGLSTSVDSNACMLTAGGQTTYTNDVGRYNVNIGVSSGGSSCDLLLKVTKDGKTSNYIVTVNNPNQVERNVTYPAIDVSLLTGSSYNSNPVPLKFKAVDNSGFSDALTCTLFVDGSTYGTYTVTSGDTKTVDYSFNPGRHVWKVSCSDSFGNSNYNSKTLNFDTIPPTITIISPNEFLNTTNVLIKFKATDNFASKLRCSAYINGSLIWSNEIDNDTVTSISKVLNANNEYELQINCLDTANNRGTTSKSFIVDTLSPVTTSSNIPTTWVNHTVSVALTATDNLAGVKAIYYKLNGGSWVKYSSPITISNNGFNNLSYYAVDNAGNSENIHHVTIKIDKVAPVTEVHSNYNWGSWTNTPIKFNFTASDSYSGVKEIFWRIDSGSWNIYSGGALTFSQSGVHTLQFYAIDNAGNKEGVISKQIKIDYGVPNIIFTPNLTTWTNKPITVNVSANDSLSGISEIEYKVVGSAYSCGGSGYTVVHNSYAIIHINNNGQWKICARAVNGAGTQSNTYTSGIYQFDNGVPTLKIVTPKSSYLNTKDVLVKLDASDSLSGISYYNISIDGGSWIKLIKQNYTFTNLVDGTHTIKVVAVDKAGNTNQSEITFVVDTKAPQINITHPVSGSKFNTHTIKLNWTASDVNLYKFEIFVNGNNVANTTSDSYTLNLVDGKYIIRVVAVDKAGNTNQSETSITVDTTSPTVTFIAPTSWVTSNFNVSFNVNDIESTVNCKVWLNGTLVFDRDVMGNVLVPITNINGGIYSLKISCNDGLNPITTVTNEVKVDNTTPVIHSISPSGKIKIGGFVVTVNATDTYSGVKTVEAIFRGHTYKMQKVGDIWKVSLYNDLTGTFDVVIKVYDNAGNIAVNSTTLNFYKPSSGSTFFGGSSGGCLVNGYKCTNNSDCCSGYCNSGICTLQPANVKLNLLVQPPIQTAFNNENEKFEFILSNNGSDIATPVTISVTGINGTLSASEVTIQPHSNKIVYLLTKLPVGNYTGTVTIKYRNTTISKTFVVHVLDYAKYKEQEYAGDVCSNASMYIMELASKGVDVKPLYSKYNHAIELMSAGNYTAASKLCDNITKTKVTPKQPITPFFILATEQLKSNAAYIAVAAILIAGVAVWLKRAAIIKWWMLRKLR